MNGRKLGVHNRKWKVQIPLDIQYSQNDFSIFCHLSLILNLLNSFSIMRTLPYDHLINVLFSSHFLRLNINFISYIRI